MAKDKIAIQREQAERTSLGDGARPPLSSGSARPINIPRDTLIGTHYGIMQVLRDSSYARRWSREMAHWMLNDLDVAEPLDKVVKLTKQLEFQVVPEDDTDEKQKEAAALLGSLIKFKEPEDVWGTLTFNTLWYGLHAGVLDTDWVTVDGTEYVGVVGFQPVHPDSVMFRQSGQPVLKVSSTFDPQRVPGCQIWQGPESRVRTLSDHPSVQEVQRWVMSVTRRQPAEFEWHEEAAKLYRGEGLRDRVFWEWYTKNHLTGQFVKLMERFGLPVPVGKFPAGNDAARQQVEQTLIDYSQGNGFLLIPVDPTSSEAGAVGIDVMEPGRGAAEGFKWYLEWAGDRIRSMIAGSTLTSHTGPTGLGSGMAEVHKDIVTLYVTDSANKNENTVTNQIVRRLQEWNDIMPEVEFKAKFIIPNDRERKEKLLGIRLAAELGLASKIKASELFDLIGLPMAEEGEETVGDVSDLAFGMGGMGGGLGARGQFGTGDELSGGRAMSAGAELANMV